MRLSATSVLKVEQWNNLDHDALNCLTNFQHPCWQKSSKGQNILWTWWACCRQPTISVSLTTHPRSGGPASSADLASSVNAANEACKLPVNITSNFQLTVPSGGQAASACSFRIPELHLLRNPQLSQSRSHIMGYSSGQNKVKVWLTYNERERATASSPFISRFLIVSAFRYHACGVNYQSFFASECQNSVKRARMVITSYQKQCIPFHCLKGLKPPTIARLLLEEENTWVSQISVYKFLRKYV